MSRGPARIQRVRGLPAAVTAVGGLSLILAGCTSAPETPSAAPEVDFHDQVVDAIADARAKGASEQQLAILDAALADDEVTFEDARDATMAAVDCMNAAGLKATYEDQTQSSGLVIPGYSAHIGLDDDGTNESIMSTCDEKESFWVNFLFQAQPSSVALEDARIEALADEFVKCFDEHGVDTEPGSSGRELMRLAIDTYVESDGAIDCLKVAE